MAEIALQRGDCKTAAETYARAARIASAPVAHRASEVGLACEDLPAAWEAAQRWRNLAPRSRESLAMYAIVALKLYRLADARAAIQAFLSAPPTRIPGVADRRKHGSPAALQGEDGGLGDLTGACCSRKPSRQKCSRL